MALENRYEFVLLFDVKDGNPNGDPDAGNLPRTDAETGNGLVSDVCLKRKVRNFVALTQGGKSGYDIYVTEKAVLNEKHSKAYTALGLEIVAEKVKKKEEFERIEKARTWMCQNFFDIRTFGAVMSNEVNCGQVRGPVQMTFARSVDAVFSSEHAITRMAVTNSTDLLKEKTMGRKFTIPYALYRENGFVNPFFADQTGFGEKDLELLWAALKNMFDFDRSAARGLMASRKLIVFKHKSKLGNAPASALFDAVKIQKKDGVEIPRDFSDYTVSIDKSKIPEDVEILELI